MKTEISKLETSIRRWLLWFMIALVASGATALDVVSGISWLHDHIQLQPFNDWIGKVYAALNHVDQQYPFLLYGYDWLALAHLVIAVAFIGPYRNPVQNEWVIQFGMIACAMVVPAAFIMGAIRDIPMWWRVVDSLFGVVGFVPLMIVWRKIQQLKTESKLFSVGIIRKAAIDVSKKIEMTVV